jgi:hypothetical protein
VHIQLNSIARALTIGDFTIDQPALLEINRKIATMGGGDSHRVKKPDSIVRYLFGVCLFFGVCKKKSGAPE